jgi:formate dehydrogenase beta subunit
VARDLAPLGYEVVIYDGDARAGGMMRTQIPKFRLPEEVIDEETATSSTSASTSAAASTSVR